MAVGRCGAACLRGRRSGRDMAQCEERGTRRRARHGGVHNRRSVKEDRRDDNRGAAEKEQIAGGGKECEG